MPIIAPEDTVYVLWREEHGRAAYLSAYSARYALSEGKRPSTTWSAASAESWSSFDQIVRFHRHYQKRLDGFRVGKLWLLPMLEADEPPQAWVVTPDAQRIAAGLEAETEG